VNGMTYVHQQQQQQQPQQPPQQQHTEQQHERQGQARTGRQSSSTGSAAAGSARPHPTAADASDEHPQLPTADSALLLLMAAARTVKAGVKLHCLGRHCSCCGQWYPRDQGEAADSTNCDNSDKDECSSDAGSDTHHLPSTSAGHSNCDCCSETNHTHTHMNYGSRDCCARAASEEPPAAEPVGGHRGTDHMEDLSPGLKDIGQLEEALDHFPTLVHCLITRGAWWQEAVSSQPLLLIQALLTITDVGGKMAWQNPPGLSTSSMCCYMCCICCVASVS
jgi:hypothetical protein